MFCSVLRRGLAKAGIETVEHDIWDDPADAAIVRDHAGGNETVPTVVIDGIGLVNPSARQVADHLAAHAPHLLPPDFEPPRQGVIGRLLR